MDSQQKFHKNILENFELFNEEDMFCDLEVHCSDGKMFMPGVIFSYLSPYFKRNIANVEDCCIIIPDVPSQDFLLFLRCLYNCRSLLYSKNIISQLVSVAQVLGVDSSVSSFAAVDAHAEKLPTEDGGDRQAVEASATREVLSDNAEDKNNMEVPQTHEDDKQPSCEAVQSGPDSEKTRPSGASSADNLVLASDGEPAKSVSGGIVEDERSTQHTLATKDIDTITDSLISDNFADQEGRLVCLVCYKIFGPSDYSSFRAHVKQHHQKMLEKVSVSLPEASRGGPGVRKTRIATDRLETLYGDSERRVFNCPKCPKQFQVTSEKTMFRKHLNYHARKDKNFVYTCAQCRKGFSDLSNLKRHVHCMHEKQLFRCLHCDFEDKRKNKLEEHLRKAHKDRTGYIGEISLNKGSGQEAIADLTAVEGLAIHPLTNHQEQSNAKQKIYVYKCSACKFKHRRESDVLAHVAEAHPELSATDQSGTSIIKRIALKSHEPRLKTLRCDVCCKAFSKNSLLNQHRLRVHNIPPEHAASGHKCRQCGVKCANLFGLRAHERSHLEKRFACEDCGRPFLSVSLLRDHAAKGTCRPENRTCQLCNKVFADKKRMEIHMKTHYNDKSFVCTVCNKGFVQKRSLKEHLLTHQAVRHFACRFCDKRFVQQNHLRYHLASLHADSLMASIENGDVKKLHHCTQCPKTFPFAYQLRRHMRVHGSASNGGSGQAAAAADGGGSRADPAGGNRDLFGGGDKPDEEQMGFLNRDANGHKSIIQCEQCSINFNRIEELKDHIKMGKCSSVFAGDDLEKTTEVKVVLDTDISMDDSSTDASVFGAFNVNERT